MADATVIAQVDTFMTAASQVAMNAALGFTTTAARTYTFPTTTATIARTDAAQTFVGVQTFADVGIAIGATTPGTITGASGALTFAAAGTNQNIVSTPSGSGWNQFGPSSLTNAIRIGAVSDATTFGIISFNGVMAGNTATGIEGGGDANIYYRCAAGAHRWLVGGSTLMTLNATASALVMTGSFNLSGVATLASATATPAGGSTAARLLFGTTAGFGIYYGSGAPSSLTAGQGSIYLNSAGSGIADRLYVNTTGSTTWTNFVSAA